MQVKEWVLSSQAGEPAEESAWDGGECSSGHLGCDQAEEPGGIFTQRFETWSEFFLRLPQWLQQVKNLPAMQETQVQFLIRVEEDLLEEEMTTHSSILAWEFSWREEHWTTVHSVKKSWTQLRD